MFKFFQRLQWKLTLSYAIVTISTVIVLAAFLVGFATYSEGQANSQVFNSFFWSKTAFQDNIPFLLDDRETLQSWLERVQAEGFTWNDFQSYTARESLDYANTLIEGSEPIYVLDPDLQLIAAAPLDDPSRIGKHFQSRFQSGPGMESILDAAQVGNKNYYAQSFTRPNGEYIVAFPLRKTDDDPVVAIVIYALKPAAIAPPINLSLYTTFFIMIFLIMLLITPPVGALFGWLASRGLRRRLVDLSAAAQAWSRGDFTPTPLDTPADEIGELTRNLNEMAQQLQALLHTRDELARVEERNRLARDLHDTVKQQTYAARMQLSAAKNLIETNPKTATEHLDAALQLNRETQQELKLIIDELRPAALKSKGLAAATQEYADRWQEHTGIQVATTVNGDGSPPLEVEQALYRVLQESLSNVARHAEPETVAISLRMNPEAVKLIVADNGRGFEADAVQPHSLGLASMKQRLEGVGGTLKVDSTLFVGTTVIAEVQFDTK
jgi:signal transduction histidine kinase